MITDLSGQVKGHATPFLKDSDAPPLLPLSTGRAVGLPCSSADCDGGFAGAGRALEEEGLTEVIVDLGKTPLARYGTPGTWELCVGLEPFMPNHDAILLENGGVLTCSEDLPRLISAGKP